jgi:hypothetical protein
MVKRLLRCVVLPLRASRLSHRSRERQLWYLRPPRNRQASPFDACEAAPVSTQAMVRPSPFLLSFPGAEMAKCQALLFSPGVRRLSACVCMACRLHMCMGIVLCPTGPPCSIQQPACVYKRSESVVHKPTSKQTEVSYSAHLFCCKTIAVELVYVMIKLPTTV